MDSNFARCKLHALSPFGIYKINASACIDIYNITHIL